MAEIVDKNFEVVDTIDNRTKFKEYVKNNKYVILKFSATWCKPCQNMKDIFKKYYISSLNYNDDIKLILVDIDKDSEISNLLRIRSVPTLVSYVNGDMEYVCTSSADNNIKKFFEDTILKIKSYINAQEYFTDVKY
tara:strand:- start:385 stop:792 length:408 start_codon:yes stop_codon:yes gene_type:complete